MASHSLRSNKLTIGHHLMTNRQLLHQAAKVAIHTFVLAKCSEFVSLFKRVPLRASPSVF